MNCNNNSTLNTLRLNRDQCEALQDIYVSLDGDNWTHGAQGSGADAWSNSTDVNNWYGVTRTSGPGRQNVLIIDLPNNNLSGDIDDIDITDLDHLQILNLSSNSIGGTLSSWSLTGLDDIEIINLSNNSIGGAGGTVFNRNTLEQLYLDNNQLNGRVPDLRNTAIPPGAGQLSLCPNVAVNPSWSNQTNNFAQSRDGTGWTSASGCPVLAPEIDVQRPAGTSIADGGADAVGGLPVGAQTLTYTIDNSAGANTLTIPAGGVTASNLVNTSGFTVNTALPLTVAAGGTSTLQIGFTISGTGAFSFDLDIDSNDLNEDPYDIAVSGTGQVALAASAVCDGDDLDVTITAGDTPFNITGTSGPDLPQNGVSTGVTTLNGPGTWVGVTVAETTGDTESTNLGNFSCGPEIDVQRPAGTSIADGAGDPVGALPAGAHTLTYTIDNSAGTSALIIPAGGVTASNFANSSGFTVNTALPLTVNAGTSTTLQIGFTVTGTGVFSFDMDIDSNDLNEDPYDIAVGGAGTESLVTSAVCNGDDLDVTITAGDNPFDITGTSGPDLPQNGVGTGVTTLNGPGTWVDVTVVETTGDTESTNLGDFDCGPEIDVQRPAGTSIADGAGDPVGALPAGVHTLTYTIDNSAGTNTLTIPAGGVTASNFVNSSGFVVNTALPLTVAAGGTATLQIGFTVTGTGTFSFDLDIDSNDLDENPYDIAVGGSGTVNLTASAHCDANDLDVTITAGDTPFDITGTSGPNLPQNGVGTGITTLNGPGTWVDVTVTETTGDLETVILGGFTCPRHGGSKPSPNIEPTVEPMVEPMVEPGAQPNFPVLPLMGGPGDGIILSAAVSPPLVTLGDTITWTFTVENRSAAESGPLSFSAQVPGGLTGVSVTTAQGSVVTNGPPTVIVNLGSIPAGGLATVSISGTWVGGTEARQGIRARVVPGHANQQVGDTVCVLGMVADQSVNSCALIFPNELPLTGGQPVKATPWKWIIAGAGFVGAGIRMIIRRRRRYA